jgi:hypothetical protein
MSETQKHPVEITVTVNTPWGPKKASVPVTADVDDLIRAIVHGTGNGNPKNYALELHWQNSGDEGSPNYEPLERDAHLIDALRGIQARPRITEDD